MNKQTLEEASWKYNPLKKLDGEFIRQAFKDGAKWQAEQDKSKYSEGEVLNIIADCDGSVTQAKKWFEKFKNK
jgi:hypothetical protein